jgi:hypothetical protein
MATIIEINDTTEKGKSLLNFLKQFKGESFIHFNEPNEETIEAINEVKKGMVTKCKSVDDLINKLNK